MLSENSHDLSPTKRKRVYYCLPLIDRIGHLIEEPYYLRQMFSPTEHEVVVFTPPRASRPRTNLVAFDIAFRHLTVVEIENESAVNAAYQANGNVGVLERDNETWLLLNGAEFRRLWIKECLQKELPLCHELSPAELNAGRTLRSQMGIPDDAPLVTLHVREPGYLPQYQYHSYRDASIQNYLPAVEYLINQGFFVLRLGDTSMTPVGGLHPRLIDVPFHSAYSQLCEPYFISQALFHIGSVSGLYHIARTFHVPTLVANAPIFADDFGQAHDLFLPKTYYSTHLGRNLSYQEVVLSEITMCCRTEEYTAAGVRLLENTTGEILSAVQEMHARLERRYASESDLQAVNQRVRNVQQLAHIWRGEKQLTPNFYAPYWAKMQLSHEYIKAHPEFLGHSWS